MFFGEEEGVVTRGGLGRVELTCGGVILLFLRDGINQSNLNTK